jgi:hypothetical protein
LVTTTSRYQANPLPVRAAKLDFDDALLQLVHRTLRASRDQQLGLLAAASPHQLDGQGLADNVPGEQLEHLVRMDDRMPSSAVITSPTIRPASAAGPSGSTERITIPPSCPIPGRVRMAAEKWTGCIAAPSQPRAT